MEKGKRLSWRMKVWLYFFFKWLIQEIRLEHTARKLYKDKAAREHFKTRRRGVKRVSDLTPEEQDWWYEEERLKWKDYYDGLL